MADGSIRIDVRADTRKANAELAQLEKKVQKTADLIEKTSTEKNAIADKLDTAKAKAEETRASIAELNSQMSQVQQDMSGKGVNMSPEDFAAAKQVQSEISQELKQQEKVLANQEKEVGKLSSQYDSVNSKLEQQTKELHTLQTDAGALRASLLDSGGRAMEGLKAGAESVSKSFSKSLKNILKWGFGIRSMFILIRKIRAGITEGFKTFAEKDPETKAAIDDLKLSLNNLKLAWGSAFVPIVMAVLPLLQKLIGWLTTAANAVNQFFSALQGKTTYKKVVSTLTQIAEAAKEAKKQLMGFDEINRLEESDKGGSQDPYAVEETEEAINPKILSFLDKVKEHLTEIKILAGTLAAIFLAWKLSELLHADFMKIVGVLGIIYGAVLLVKGAFDAWENGLDLENLQLMLGGIAVAATAAAIAFGTIGAAITLLIGGIALLVVGFHEWITTGELTTETLTAIVIGIGLVAAAIGLLTGSAGIGLLIAGIGLLVVGIMDWINTGELSERTFQILENGFLLVGGAIALLTGSWIPLLIAGIAMLALYVVQHWDEIKEKSIEIWGIITDWISEKWESLKLKVSTVFGEIALKISGAWQTVKDKTLEIWEAITTWISGKWESLKLKVGLLFVEIALKIVNAWQTAKDKTTEIWNNITTWVSEKWDALKTKAETVWEAIKEAPGKAWSSIESNAKEIWGSITKWLEEKWDAIKTKAQMIWIQIATHIEFYWNLAKTTTENIWNSLVKWVSEKWDALKTKVQMIWIQISTHIEYYWNLAKQRTSEVWNSIGDWLTEKWEGIKTSASTTWTEIADAVVGAFDTVKDRLETAWGNITGWFEGIWNDLVTWWQGLSFPEFHIPMPHVDVWWEGIFGGDSWFQIPHFSVQWYAKGGIVDKATLFGAGEAGKEAVLPLENNTGWIRELAEQLFAIMEDKFGGILSDLPMPAIAMGGIAPPRAVSGPSLSFSDADISKLVAGIQSALGENNGRTTIENKIYLDGRQIADAVTKWQRVSDRSGGTYR